MRASVASCGSFARAAATALKIVDRRSAQRFPILGNVLLRAESGRLTVAAHSLDHCITAGTAAEIGDADAACCIDAKRITSLLTHIDEKAPIVIETVDTGMVLRAGRSRYRLNALSPDDFPRLLSPGADVAEAVLDEKARDRLLRLPLISCEKEETRYYLCGVCWSCEAGGLHATASMGHHLTAATSDVAVTGNPRTIIIPTIAATVMANAAGTIRVRWNSNIIEMRDDDRDVVYGSKLVAATYPDWKRIVPEASANRIDIDRKTLLAALARIAAVATDVSGGMCGLTIDGTGLNLSIPREPEAAADILDNVRVDFDGRVRFACSIAYLSALINNFETERVVLDFGADVGRKEAYAPVRITAPGDDNLLSILCPARW